MNTTVPLRYLVRIKKAAINGLSKQLVAGRIYKAECTVSKGYYCIKGYVFLLSELTILRELPNENKS